MAAQAGYYGHYGYRHHHGHNGGDAGAYLLGGLLLGGLVGYLIGRDAGERDGYGYRQRSYRPALYDCRVTTGEGIRNGRRALYEGVLCRGPEPGWYVKPGTKRFIGYLN